MSTNYECSSEWERMKSEIVARIDFIDKNTVFEASEPAWWLEMMEIRRKIQESIK